MTKYVANAGFLASVVIDFVKQCESCRTASEVKAAITKSGCKVAEPGSVMFNFSRAGMVRCGPRVPSHFMNIPCEVVVHALSTCSCSIKQDAA